MIWPPLKAWTSKISIDGHIYFVAINYGGENLDRWIILMAVLDSNVVFKVSWSKLIDPSKWICGWDENNFSMAPGKVDYKTKIGNTNLYYPSNDSGLTMPITKNTIRSWFREIQE